MRYKGLNERFFSNSRYQQKTSAFCLFSAVIARLVDDGFGEDGGDLVGGEGEAGAYGGEGGGELRVVFASVMLYWFGHFIHLVGDEIVECTLAGGFFCMHMDSIHRFVSQNLSRAVNCPIFSSFTMTIRLWLLKKKNPPSRCSNKIVDAHIMSRSSCIFVDLSVYF